MNPPQQQQQAGPGQPQQQAAPQVDPDVVLKHITGHMTRMCMYRKQYDQRRAYLYRQYLSQRDQPKFPDNVTLRANTFVPYPQSNVEQVVSRVDDAFYSNYPFFETRGRGLNDDEPARKMQMVLEYKLQQAQLKHHLEMLTRNGSIYGHMAMKVDWDWEYDIINGPEPVYAMQIVPQTDPSTGQPMIVDGKMIPQIGPDGKPVTQPQINPQTGQPMQIGTKMVTKKVPRMRPKFIPIDIYDLLVDPDGGYLAHMVERTLPQLMREAESNPNLYLQAGLQELTQRLSSEPNADEILIRIAEFWDVVENTVTVLTYPDTEAISWKDLRSSFRGTSYSGFKRKAFGGKPILLYTGPNQFAHKQCPILHTSYIKLPNEVYGLGLVESISDLSESLNRMVNMVTDNWNMGINRRYAYDVNADIDHEALKNFNVPGGRVAVNGNPANILQELPTFSPNNGDYAILDLFKGMIGMTSGVDDFYGKGTGSAGGNRTATGIQQVIGESNYRFRMFIRNLELDIIQPMLAMCSSMVQQFCTDQVEYMITDEQPGIPKYGTVKLEELIGNYDFMITAANYATNKTIRQRQMMAFAQIAGQSGYILEYPSLIELGRTMELPHPERFLKTEQQMQQEQQAQQQAQAAAQQNIWQHEAQMMILQALLSQQVDLQKARSLDRTNPGPGQGAGGGRPATSQFEGKLPGAGMSSAIRTFAQSFGSNAIGLSGMGEVNHG